MARSKNPSNQKRQTTMQTANQMFLDAFMVKKNKFSQSNPQLSESELNKITAQYFRKLADGSK